MLQSIKSRTYHVQGILVKSSDAWRTKEPTTPAPYKPHHHHNCIALFLQRANTCSTQAIPTWNECSKRPRRVPVRSATRVHSFSCRGQRSTALRYGFGTLPCNGETFLNRCKWYMRRATLNDFVINYLYHETFINC
jgi:hypothetical protein